MQTGQHGLQVVPILRAGLVLVEQIATVLPAQVTYHVGLVRNEETLQVACLPWRFCVVTEAVATTLTSFCCMTMHCSEVLDYVLLVGII